MPNPEGRPLLLTPKSQERFIQALLQGATYELACNYAGFSYVQYRSYMIRGEKEESGIYRTFFDAVNLAKGESAVKWLEVIERAMVKDWQAAAWKLERRFWKGYSKHVETIGISEMASEIKDKQSQGESNGDVDSKGEKQDSQE